ncbi:MAG: hypothetical protein ABW158_16275 [Candidatus Thiodiazotropha sp. 6PDIVS]
MKFSRITENQAYEYIVEATKRLHEKGIECKEISMHPAVQKLGLNFSRCTTSGYGLTGQGEYSALFVAGGANGYRVFDIYIDTLSPEDTSVEEITESLGKLNPEHQQCDIRKPITMAVLYLINKTPSQKKLSQ